MPVNGTQSAGRPSLILKNCRLVNVCSGEIYPTDISIDGGLVRSIEPVEGADADEVIDCKGLYAAPGLIDPHMHVDTTFLWPDELARVLVPMGTTTLFVDTTNISHVGGVPAVRALMDSFRGLPLKARFAAPSYCPLDPSLETAAVDFTHEDIRTLLDAGCVSIGETVWSKINLGHEDYFTGIQLCRDRECRVSGHGDAGSGDESAFDGYVAAGIQDDHNLKYGRDIRPRLRRGLRLFCVETQGRIGQLPALMAEALAAGHPLRHFCLCVDNITLMFMVAAGFGYLDHLVRLAIRSGVPPVEAYRMATLNPAEHYRLSGQVGAIAPGRSADILLLKELDAFPPEWVFVDGKAVARSGRFLGAQPPAACPEVLRKTIDLQGRSRPSLSVMAKANRSGARARVIEVRDSEAFNRAFEVDLAVADGRVQPDPARDILIISVVERYGRNGNVGRGFVKGFGLKRGAIASSLSIPSNNLVSVGTNEDDIWRALERIEAIQGGFVVVDEGRILAEVPLPFGGIMANTPHAALIGEILRADDAARGLGCTLRNPFYTMAQTVLSTLPDLGLTDRGLVDANRGRTVPVLVEDGSP
jgi:adenine deaminase